ncbi:hypothetical protein GUITHDRAFT_175552 [Guillardia theta CCMP2712]|uniref:Cytoplasmic dynein 2 light intermediate chain 1 n=1 Tax=Guillardia theta (strain CCMP2712) TaxID=905079 RepID=L1IYK4_GUITC|nr:hypothetical protein GUITHDRAFT_175552 [Guillardia theta CCMP2712]EKX40905.1 hypothetical protein GUITHDRAFT_175552 [Guillardia theta CCMP2712]|eukprot:XP_005827885.1 hypothetical protein GUITHDRAFT_175552 [Guillardia theta CCMP2712]
MEASNQDYEDEQAPNESRSAETSKKETNDAPKVEKKVSSKSLTKAPPTAKSQGSTQDNAGGNEEQKDLMKMIVQMNRKQASQQSEGHAILVGTKSSGKSTLIQRCKSSDKDDELQPTIALDYSFARTVDKGKTGNKDVAHFWEVGGGTSLPDLLDVPLNENNLKNVAFVIVADLSKPSEVIAVVQFWLRKLERRIQTLEQICKKDPKQAKLIEMLKDRSIRRFGDGGEKHKDMQGPLSNLFKIHPVNIVIVASKYDEFAHKDPELKKVMSRTLRFLAHTNGSSLLYTSQNEKQLISNFRQILSQYLLKGQQVRKEQRVVDHLKPLLVPAGSDLLEDIGAPPVDVSSLDRSKLSDPLHLWLHYFESCFGEIPSLHADEGPAFILDPKGQYKEASIDKALAYKEEDLKMYKEMQEREKEEQAKEAKPPPTRKVSKAPSIRSKPKSNAPSQE